MTAPMTADRPAKLLYLESLRGLAALSVVLFHAGLNLPILDNLYVRNSWLMVDFFFVLSGFVIALNYQGRITNPGNLLTFQVKRFLRIYPLHLVMLLAYLGVELAKFLFEFRTGIAANLPAFSVNNPGSFAHNLALTHNLFLREETWNGPSWSVSAEFYTYILFGLVVLATRRAPLLLYGLAVALIVLSFVFLRAHGMTPGTGFVRCVYAFFLGVLACNASRVLPVRLSPLLSYGALILAVLAVIYVREFGNVETYVPLIFTGFILSLVGSRTGNLLVKTLEHRLLVYLGTISYGIYMIHFLVIWCLVQAFRFVLDHPTYVDGAGAVRVSFEGPVVAWFSLAAIIAVTFGLAHLSYRYVETPANRLRHRL